MLVTCVEVHIVPGHEDDFIRATEANHAGAVQEPGNLRFDLLRRQDDPSAFLLYEAYESEAAAVAHKDTVHYRAWREVVAPWMAQPRKGIPHTVVCPVDRSGW